MKSENPDRPTKEFIKNVDVEDQRKNAQVETRERGRMSAWCAGLHIITICSMPFRWEMEEFHDRNARKTTCVEQQ